MGAPSSSTQQAVVSVLNFLCSSNRGLCVPVDEDNPFSCTWEYQSSGVEWFIARLAEWGQFTDDVLVGGLCLLARAEEHGRVPPVTNATVHRIFLAFSTLAAQFLEDRIPRNSYLAKVGCLPPKHFNQLQLEALRALDFRAFISPTDLAACNVLMARASDLRLQKSARSPRAVARHLHHRTKPEPATTSPVPEAQAPREGVQQREEAHGQRRRLSSSVKKLPMQRRGTS